MKKYLLVFSLGFFILFSLFFVKSASAETGTRTINSVLLGGATSTVVKGSASVSVSIDVTTTGTSLHFWRSTSYKIGDARAATCVITGAHSDIGTFTESFDIVAPADEGTYPVVFKAYDNSSCGTGVSNIFTLTNGLIVDLTPPTIDSVVDITTEATSADGAEVTINPPFSHDNVDGNMLSSCDKSTGIFPVGITTIACTKTDTAGNVATPAMFTITVAEMVVPPADPPIADPPVIVDPVPVVEPAPVPPVHHGGGYLRPRVIDAQIANVSSGGQVLGVQSFHFTLPLRHWSEGEEVVELQKKLIKDGYLKILTPVGHFGPLTEEAVRKFQLEHGLKADGAVGQETRLALNG